MNEEPGIKIVYWLLAIEAGILSWWLIIKVVLRVIRVF
jgi:hypothetical protein